MTPEALAALHAAAQDRDRAWSAGEFAALLAAPGALLLDAEGGLLLGRVAADEAEILTLAVHPARRRLGLARGLLGAFLAAAARRGAARAALEVAEDNAPARALYAGAGFAPVGSRPGYYPRPGGPPAAALVLARPLRRDRESS